MIVYALTKHDYRDWKNDPDSMSRRNTTPKHQLDEPIITFLVCGVAKFSHLML